MMKKDLEKEILRLEEENKRLRNLLKLQETQKDKKLKLKISDIVDIDQLKILFEKFSALTGYTTGFVDHNTRDVLISTGWTDICKKYHRGTKSSEYICKDSNKELTKNLNKIKQINLHKCQHGMVDGATPIIIDGEHLANLFSGQVLFDKPNIDDFKLGAKQYGYDMDAYLDALRKVKIISEDKLKEVLEFLSFIANLIAQLGKERKEYILLNDILEKKIVYRTKEKDILLSLFDKGDSVLFKWNYDKYWSISYASKSIINLLEYSSEEFLDNFAGYIDCIYKDDIKVVQKELKDAIDKEKEFFKHKPYRVISKSGVVKWVLTSIIIIRDDNSKIEYLIGYVNDITEEKEKDKILYEQTKLASMGEMIANIAHQWRQPLTVISTAATGLELRKQCNMLDDELFYTSCKAINDNAQHLSKIIDDFTNFIRGDRTKSLFNLKNEIESFLHLVDSSIKKYDINMIINIDDGLKIFGYPSELLQCFINIFNNSKDALNDYNIEDKYIFISATTEDDNTIIKFKDNAGGIDEDIIPKIFEPYFTTKHQSQGTGLGLHMTYNFIVDGMGGSIDVNNKKYIYNGINYIGAEFSIVLPLSI